MRLKKAIEFLRNTPHPRAKYDEVVVQRVIADIRAIRGESMMDQYGELHKAILQIQWSQLPGNDEEEKAGLLEEAWQRYYTAKAALGEAYYSDECRRIVEEGFGHPVPVGTRNTTTTTTTSNSHEWWIKDTPTPYDSPIQIY